MTTWGELAKQLGYANSDELLAAAQKSNAEYDRAEEAARLQREERRWREIRESFIPWDEIRANLKCKPEVWARIRKMNPDHRGIKAGNKLRGYHRRPTAMDGLMSFWLGPKQFIKMFGREAYREIPKRHLRNKGHKKLISLQYSHIVGLKRIDLNEQEKDRRGHTA